MARHVICFIHGHDAELLARGIMPKCSEHAHIDRETAQLMVSGAGLRPWLDPSFVATGRKRGGNAQISERHDATAFWATLEDGTASSKYLVRAHARSWQVEGGAMQYLPLGATQPQRKRGHTHMRKRFTARRTGFKISRRVDTTQSPAMLAKAVCRPSLLRKPTPAL